MNRLLHTATGNILIEKLLVRATFWGRLRGLLFYDKLETGTAMLLVNTKKVHTNGMFFPLDLYFFDRSMHLIDSQYSVMPWRLPESPQGTQHILEIQHNTTNEPLELNQGEQVSIHWKIGS